MTPGEVRAGLWQAEYLAHLHHQHWAADACAQAARLLTDQHATTRQE